VTRRSLRRVARIALSRAGFALGRLLPLKSTVVFATSHLPYLSGNLRFIADELRRTHPGVPVTEITLKIDHHRLARFEFYWAAVRSGYLLARARVVLVDDFFFPMYVVTPRAGTIRVQVWHAAGAFKKFGYSVLDKTFGADEETVSKVAIHSNYSIALVSSMNVAKHYADAFNSSLDIFCSAVGLPRTDVFGDPDQRAAAEARARAAFPQAAGRRVVLYAPTFRGETVRYARYENLLDLEELHRTLGDGHLVLLKLHPFIREGLVIPPGLADFAVDAGDYPDVNDLMFISDILVSDYSSVIYEFALLGRPILFLAPDEDAYDIERGFYFDFRREAPGPIFEDTAGLAAAIRDQAWDIGRVRDFAAANFDVVDGQASRRIVEEIILPSLRGEEVTAATLQERLRP
jgi:CDP-glycerol glycerophosphotransferase (TagB/SpsB family)